MAETTADRAPQAYFDTPERSERLQLVAHLVRNADAIPYIRGPKGAGKTRFAERLAAIFRQEARLVELAGAGLRDLQAAVNQSLGSPQGDWPAAAIAAAGDAGLLVMVDDADHLDATALQALEALRGRGASLVFLGSKDPAALPGNWNFQLIDLPPLSERQLRDFLDFLDHPESVLLKDSELAMLHRSSQGQPGAVLAALVSGRVAHGGAALTGLLPWRWLAAGLGVLLAILVLWQQDRINALFEAPAEEAGSVSDAIAIPAPTPAEPARPAAETAMPVAVPPVQLPVVEEGSKAAEDASGIVPQPAVEESAARGEEAVEHDAAGPAIATPAASPVAASVAAPATDSAVAPKSSSAEPEVKSQPGREIPDAAGPAGPQVTSGEPAASGQTVSAAAPTDRVTQPPRDLLDMAWLGERRATAYTLQLAGARDRRSLESVVARHHLSGKCLIFERQLKGKPWYSLVCGDYPDRNAAVRARAALPKPLRQAWPRTFASIRQQLPR